MSWIDDLNKECIDAINNSDWHPDRIITVLAKAIARLNPEARRMEKVRHFADADLWADVRECSCGCKRKLREIIEDNE